MKKLFIVLCLCCLLNTSFAQGKSDTYSKWHINLAAGVNIPLTNLLSGEITDYLFEYNDNSFYWQLLSASYFFSSKWGIDFTYQAGYAKTISGRADSFNMALTEKYGGNYFVSSGSGAMYNNFSFIGGSIERGYFGLVYRHENLNFIFLPMFSIGVTSFYTDWGRADLKEIGTNNFYKLTYDSGKRPNDHFTLAPSFTLGYRLSERVIAKMEVLYTFYKTEIEFTEEIRNTFTGQVFTKTIDYKKSIHTLTSGLGLIVEL